MHKSPYDPEMKQKDIPEDRNNGLSCARDLIKGRVIGHIGNNVQFCNDKFIYDFETRPLMINRSNCNLGLHGHLADTSHQEQPQQHIFQT